MQLVAAQNIDMEQEYNDQQLILPIEMILQIISKLTAIEDIKNCMLLSKEIKNSIFILPEFMRNIRFQLKCYKSDESLKVLKKHGRQIRCVNIISEVCTISPKIFKNALNKVPNLEDLKLESKIFTSLPTSFHPFENKKLEDFWNDNEDSVDMSKLKTLTIDVRDLGYFLKTVKNLKNLVKLTIFSYDTSSEELMFDFICQQHNLKELNVINHCNIFLNFPKEDSISKVKFRLKKFKFVSNWKDAATNENFLKFLAVHIGTLDELEVDSLLNVEVLQLIFEKSQNLQKLTFKSNKCLVKHLRINRNWILPKLKHFCDQNSEGLNLDLILRKFPNLESLKCSFIAVSGKKFETLKRLEVETMNPFCIFREEIMRNSLIYIKNVEHLVIRNSHTEMYAQICKHLDVLDRLKTFSYRADPRSNIINETQDNEEVPTDYKMYKIMADMERKTLKVSTYIVKHDKKLFDVLIEKFKGFEFYEFCFDVIKIERINVEEN